MKILVIRTIQSDLLGAFLNSLKDAYPKAEFYLMDNQKQAAFSKGQQFIQDEIFWTTKPGDYGIGNLSCSTVNRIRKLKFNKVIIPHKQPGIDGFENVLLLLPILKINSWFHCSIDWNLQKINKLNLIKLMLYYCLAFPVFMILLPITLVSFCSLILFDLLRKSSR